MTDDGLWTLCAVAGDELTTLLLVSGSAAPEALGAAMLADAFEGRVFRRDLIDAFVATWSLAPDGFVLSAEDIAGWSLRWALERGFADDHA